jgi:succinoglycan biosynthesis transport protein ExoP
MTQQIQTEFSGESEQDSAARPPAPSEEIARLLAILNRQKNAILWTTAVAFALGVLFLLQSVKTYTSSTSVMIDSRQVGMSATTPLEGAIAFDTGAVDSQVLLIQSDHIVEKVLQRLDLAHNQAFLDPPASGVGWLAGKVGKFKAAAAGVAGAAAPVRFEALPADVQRDILTRKLQANVRVTRNARTYVLTIEYSDPNPAMARTIAAAFASAYLDDQLDSRFETSRRASTWIEDRIREIKQKADAAVKVAQEFRTRNRLTEASGRLINDQSLTDANTQLSMARNDLNSAQAKYERLKQIVDSRDYGASSLDALANPIISGWRAKYLEAYRMNSDISSRLGPSHLTAVRARTDMDEYSKIMFQELSRLLKGYQSEVAIVKDRIGALEKTIETQRLESDVDTTNMTTLKSLETESTTYNNLYTAYLQKAQELVQQQSIPISDARIISDAELPVAPSSPKTTLILLGSIVFGLMAGGGVALVREFRDRGFRMSSQVRDVLGLDFTSYLPMLASEDLESRPVGESETRPRGARETPRLFRSPSRSFDIVLDEPMSHFSEAMRSIKVAMDYHFGLKRPLVIGFASIFPDEGKSTATKNFASLLAKQGEKTLLIDCDLRNPHLTRSLTPKARAGLMETLTGGAKKSLEGLLYLEERSGLAFLPACSRGELTASGDLLSTPVMLDLVRGLRSEFDVIVIDLAPLGLVKDASAAAAFVDGYHLIVEWGRTARAAVANALATDPMVAERIIGVSLSKVDIDRLALFDANTMHDYARDGYYRDNETAGFGLERSSGIAARIRSILGGDKPV